MLQWCLAASETAPGKEEPIQSALDGSSRMNTYTKGYFKINAKSKRADRPFLKKAWISFPSARSRGS